MAARRSVEAGATKGEWAVCVWCYATKLNLFLAVNLGLLTVTLDSAVFDAVRTIHGPHTLTHRLLRDAPCHHCDGDE